MSEAAGTADGTDASVQCSGEVHNNQNSECDASNCHSYDRPKKSLHILMSSLMHKGRAQSLMAIAAELIRRRHKVTFAVPKASFYETLQTLATGVYASQVNLVLVGQGEFTEEDDNAADRLRNEITKEPNSDALHVMRMVVKLLSEQAARDAPFFRDLLRTHHFDVIVADINAFGLLLASEMENNRIPVVLNHPILAQGEFPAIETQSGYYPASNGRKLYDISFLARMNNVIRRRIGALVTDSIIKSHEPMLEAVGLPPDSHRPVLPILVGTAFGFEVPHEVPPHLIYTGPMIDASVIPQHLADADPHVQWASSTSSCPGGVFFASLGTSVTLAGGELNSLARVLLAAQDENQLCFLWALKESQQDLLELDIKNAMQANEHFRLAPSVAQRLLLRWAPVVGHLTHGGVASVSESLYFGVPLVVMPFLFDQVDLAARVQAAHAGIDIGPHRPHDGDAILRGIRAVCSDDTHEQYRSDAERIGELFRRAGGTQRAADVIEDVARFGTQHLIPLPYREFSPWYVHADTDVVVVLTTLGWMLILSVFKLLRVVVSRCRKRNKEAKVEAT